MLLKVGAHINTNYQKRLVPSSFRTRQIKSLPSGFPFKKEVCVYPKRQFQYAET
jgi:hypothetical protein